MSAFAHTFAFGPLRFRVRSEHELPVSPWCDRHRAPDDGLRSREVSVRLVDALPAVACGFRDTGFAVTRGDHDEVVVERALAFRWGAALSALVAHDAPAAGCVAVHAAAVRVARGVVLLVAPGGTGKTTFASLAGARSFAHNAVLVRVSDEALTAWSLPFAGDPRPELDAPGSAEVVALALLRRAETPGFEWISRSEATMAVVRACARAPGRDPLARERFVLGSSLASRVPVGRVHTTRSPRDLDALEIALRTETLEWTPR